MDIRYTLPNMMSTLQIVGCHSGQFVAPWSYPWHHHYLYELLYCKSGQLTQYVGNKRITLQTGECMLIKAGILHASELTVTDPYHFFNLHFDIDDSLIREQLSQYDYIVIPKQQMLKLGLLDDLTQLEDTIQKNNEPTALESEKARFRLIIQAHTLTIISHFIDYIQQSKCYAGITAPTEQTLSTIAEADIAHKIEILLREQTHLRIHEIATKLGMTRGRVTMVFTKVYGQSPRQYLSKLVMNKAKHLLVHSSFTIEEIAEQLAFQSASHFSRQFRRWTGMSPSMFRPKYVRTTGWVEANSDD